MWSEHRVCRGWLLGEERGTHLPSMIELVVAHKVGVVALERVEEERLVRLGDLVVREPPLVRQVHLGRQRAHVQAGRLGVQLEVHGLGGLDAQDELVARDVLEDALRDVLELDAHFHFGLVQGLVKKKKAKQSTCQVGRDENEGSWFCFFTFSGFEDEGHAFPTGILDPQRRRSESGACGIWWDAIVIEVAWFSVGTHILPEEGVVSLDRGDCA